MELVWCLVWFGMFGVESGIKYAKRKATTAESQSKTVRISNMKSKSTSQLVNSA